MIEILLQKCVCQGVFIVSSVSPANLSVSFWESLTIDLFCRFSVRTCQLMFSLFACLVAIYTTHKQIEMQFHSSPHTFVNHFAPMIAPLIVFCLFQCVFFSCSVVSSVSYPNLEIDISLCSNNFLFSTVVYLCSKYFTIYRENLYCMMSTEL